MSRLNATFAFNASLGNTAQIVQQVQQQYAQLQQTAAALGLTLGNLNLKFDTVDKAAARAAQGMRSNWSQVIRIFESQIIHRSLTLVINTFTQAQQAAIDFQIKISEIRTISQQSQLSFTEFSNRIRELSDAFGLDIIDVARAEYQALSNQVTQGAASFDFLRTSLEFSKVTVTSAENGVNLLSSAIKAYGVNNVSAERAASVLFKTIDLGRIEAEQVANIFGNTAALAAQLKIPLEEVGAALATITVQGVRPDTALTLFNNVLVKLLKPTKEMDRLFRELGVASGESAIQTFGFVGVIRKLQEQLASGGLAQIADLESDIRALRGTIALTGNDSFANFEDSLRKFGSAAEDYRNATEIIRESSGDKLRREFNKTRNFFVAEFATKIIDSVVQTTAPFGGLSNILIQFGRALQQVTTLGLTFVSGLSQIAISLSPILPSFKSLVKLFELYLITIVAIRAVNIAQVFLTSSAAIFTYAGSTTAAATAINGMRAAISGLGPALAIAIPLFIALGEAQTANEIAARSNEFVIKERERKEEDLSQHLSTLRDTEVKSFKDANDEKFLQLNGFIANVRRELTLLSDFTKKSDNEVVANIADNIDAFTQDISRKILSFQQLQKETEKNIADSQKEIIKIRTDAEQKGFERTISDKGSIQQNILTLNRVEKLRTEGINLFNNDELEESRKKFEEIDKLLEKVFDRQKTFRDKLRKLGVNVPLQIVGGDTNTALKQNADDRVKIEQLFIDRQKLRFKEAKQKEEQLKALNESAVKINQVKTESEKVFNENINKSTEGIKSQGNSLLKIQNIASGLITDFNKIGTFDAGPLGQINSLFAPNALGAKDRTSGTVNEFNQAVSNLLGNPNIVNAKKLQDALTILGPKINEAFAAGGDPNSQARFAEIQNLVNNFVKSNQETVTAQKNLQDIKTSQAELFTQLSQLPIALQNIGVQVNQVNQQQLQFIDIQRTRNSELIDNLQKILDIKRQITEQDALQLQRGFAPIGPGRAFGGGTDSLLTPTTPGETIMNVGATRRFHTQLLSMNSGIAPRAIGNTTNVGDLVFNVNGSTSPNATAREVLSLIKRELRRGNG